MPQPAKSLPQKIIHYGKYCRLEPLSAKAHGRDLWLSAGNDETLWTHLFYGPFADETQFCDWLELCQNHTTRCYYAILDQNNKALGALCLMDCDLANATIELGGIFFSKQLQRTRIASEAVFLLSNYAFKNLGFRRLQWKCDVRNEASQKAALRFGFKKEGILRNHMIVRGISRDSAFFSILDCEWEKYHTAFLNWLDEKNFDATGKQKQRLQIQ